MASEHSERLNERSECKNTLMSDAVVVSLANEDKETTQSNKSEAIGAKEEASRASKGETLVLEELPAVKCGAFLSIHGAFLHRYEVTSGCFY